MSYTTEIADVLVIDRGPVRDAALILAEHSTLAEHVSVVDGDYTTSVEMNTDVPFELWGSGTQALWRLLSAIAYSRHGVSLYEVASRVDQRNSAAVSAALTALFAGLR